MKTKTRPTFTSNNTIAGMCFVSMVLMLCACRGAGFLSKHNFVDDAAVKLTHDPKENIIVHYIGCSGFFIRKGEDIVLIDPYFFYKALTRTRLLDERIGIGLRTEIDNVFTRAIGTKNDSKGVIDALLLGHAHVDHMGDVPYLYRSGHLNRRINIIGSTTAGHYLRANEVPPGNIIGGIEASASSWLSNGTWVPVNKHIRVLPIISEHAPHARILGININLASGKHESKDTKHCLPPCYGTGQTLSYLIDFLNDNGSINFRIYHCSAAANSPNGFPPASVLAGHPVDLQIVCAASFNQVDNYPEEIVRYLKPRHIVLSHWEDFMLSRLAGIKRHPRTNGFYSYRNFFKRFELLLHDINDHAGTEIKYTLPNVDSKLTFRY